MTSILRVATLFTLTLCSTAAVAEYFVVLGVYNNRDVALGEYRAFDDDRLFISIDETPRRTRYLIMNGPFDSFAEATERQTLWIEGTVPGAWVTRRDIPLATLKQQTNPPDPRP